VDDRHQTGQRARTVRFWTALIVYAGAGWATVEVLLAAREHYLLPDTMNTVVIGLFVAGFLATVLLLKTRLTGADHPILQAFRAFAVVLMLAALALLIAYWLEPGDAERITKVVLHTDARLPRLSD
jgi:purine-cytosine permease-like protein